MATTRGLRFRGQGHRHASEGPLRQDSGRILIQASPCGHEPLSPRTGTAHGSEALPNNTKGVPSTGGPAESPAQSEPWELNATGCPLGHREPAAKPISAHERGNRALLSGDHTDSWKHEHHNAEWVFPLSRHTWGSEDRHNVHGAGATSKDELVDKTLCGLDEATTPGSVSSGPVAASGPEYRRPSTTASSRGSTLVAESATRKGVPHRGGHAVLFLRRPVQRPNRALPEVGDRRDSPPRNPRRHPMLGPTPSRSARTSWG